MDTEAITLSDKMCRTCLKEEAQKNIFDLHKPSSTDYASILKSCVYLEVNKEDDLPKNICTKCLKILLGFHKFKVTAVENEYKLKRALENKLREEANQPTVFTIQSIQEVKIVDGEIEQQEPRTKTRSDYSEHYRGSPNYNGGTLRQLPIRRQNEHDKNENNDKHRQPQTYRVENDVMPPLAQTFEVVSAVLINNNPKPVPDAQQATQDEPNETISTDDLTFVTDSDSSDSDRENSKSDLEDTFKIKPGVKCTECGKILSSKRNLNQHMTVHTKKKPYSCNICDKKFTRAEHVLIHKRIHTGERPHKCLICKKTFIQYATLKAHLGTHSNEKPHMCTVCGKSFKQSASLSTHSRIHTGEIPYVCELCGKGFRTAGTLSIHMRFHSKERPFICIQCDKTFVTSSHLRVHHKSHTGEKPHKCIICYKAFARSEHLKSHLVIHSGRKPYQCKLCPKKYTQSSHLRRHAKAVHESKGTIEGSKGDSGIFVYD